MTRGVVFYDGPSMMTGDRIIGVMTGLADRSQNAKTGAMVQAWILLADLAPMDAKRVDRDGAICGDCKLRGRGGFGAECYVTVWQAPHAVWKSWRAGGYPPASPAEAQALVEGRAVRCGAYGDPAAMPFDVWHTLLRRAAGWVAYTHAWRTCDRRFQAVAMASVDTPAEADQARAAGWRTFRIRGRHDPITHGQEFICPASDEAGHRATCLTCQLCRGWQSPARSVAIVAHGKPGNVAAFYRRRERIAS